jgi:hypothetical protein
MTDSRKQLLFIFAVAIGAICVYGVIRFLTEDEPARLRGAIYTSVLGLEKKDRARYGAIISSQYQDAEGNNKLTLLKGVEDALRDFEPVKCDIKQLTVEMKEKTAAEVTVGFKFYFKNIRDMKLYYDAGRVLAHFVKEGRSWRIQQLDYIEAKEIYSIQGVG